MVHSTCEIIAARNVDNGSAEGGLGMDKAEILMLFDYSAWANRRILDAAEGLSQEQFTAPAGSTTAACAAHWSTS